MSSVASCSQSIDGSSTSSSAHYSRIVIAFIYCIVFLTAIVWTGGIEIYGVSIKAIEPSDLETDVVVISIPDVVVVSIPNVGFPKTDLAEAESSDNAAAPPGRSDTSLITGSTAELPRPASPPPGHVLMPEPAAPTAEQKLQRAMKPALAGGQRNAVNPFTYSPRKVLSKFAAAYRSVLKLLAIMELPRILQDAALTHAMIVGTASAYDPYSGGKDAGGVETASGELYDSTGWTAAIQTGLREQFGGVRYGKLYRPAYALVRSGNKQLIVKINDVGPLRPDRVIDLNERSMRYFDPFLQRGLISDVTVMLLPGEDWTPGPLGGEQPINFASAYASEPPPVQHAQQQATLKLFADRTYDGHGDIDVNDRVQTCQGAGACISPVALHLSPPHDRSRQLLPSL
jgi:peptidoglycan lytic transglycosylase